MITGYNTDVEYNGVTYHVQTEDKGPARPMILSLVYDGGTVLASKRLAYDDLVSEGLDEKVLAARLERQHALICAAIRAGRIDDLKRLGSKDSEAAPEKSALNFAQVQTAMAVSIGAGFDQEAAIPMPGETVLPAMAPLPPVEAGAGKVTPDEFVLPADAVSVVSDLEGRERKQNNKLTIELMEDGKLNAGERRTVTFMVCRGTDHKVVPSVPIMVKVLGTNFRPLIYHALTDANGVATLSVQLPRFTAGRGALVARATHEGEEVELRRVIASV